jgi:oligopeptide transport system substrate-binding protein
MRVTLLLRLLCLLLFCLPGPVSAAGLDADASRISLALRSEPPSLNSLRSTDRISSFVLAHIMEGLVRYGADGKLRGAAASHWEWKGPREVVFYLREHARWSDGKPLKAQDFVDAWRTVVLPETNARYASLLAPVKNAEAIMAGESPASTLGVYADDDRTLRIVLNRTTPHFVDLTAFMTLYPLREDIHQRWGKAYAADADKLVFNGPYQLARWIHGAHLTMRKNKLYWNEEAVRIAEIDIPYITSDSNAVMNLFKNGDIALADELKATGIAQALQDDMPLHSFDNGSLYFYAFNFRERSVASNRALREAISLLVSPDTVTRRLLSVPGARAAHSLYPAFLELAGEPMYGMRDLALAREKLRLAKQQLGVEELPPIRLLIDDAQDTVRRAEYLQFLLQRSLGLQLVLDRQTFKQRISKSMAGDYDMVARSWSPDFNDAMTFAELFASHNPNNRSRYHSQRYDRLLAQARSMPTGSARNAVFLELQKTLAGDVALLPLFESNILYVMHPRLRGVQRQIFGGDPSFISAWID